MPLKHYLLYKLPEDLCRNKIKTLDKKFKKYLGETTDLIIENDDLKEEIKELEERCQYWQEKCIERRNEGYIYTQRDFDNERKEMESKWNHSIDNMISEIENIEGD